MKRIALFGGLAAALILVVTIWMKRQVESQEHAVVRATDQDVEKARRRAGTWRPPPTPEPLPTVDLKQTIRLAVGGLGLGGEQDGEVSDLAVADLSHAPGLVLLERQQLDAALDELKLSLSGLVRAKDALRVGQLIRADWFVLGSPFRLAGTNAVILRLVDARTGALRDAGVIDADRSPDAIASELSSFVQGDRSRATTNHRPNFVALGGFDNVGVNSRLTDLPTELRAGLTAAYQGSDVTLLEREFVEEILREIALDTAGLTTGAATDAPVRIQPAFWLLEGSYQS